jgi:hypothetical protein
VAAVEHLAHAVEVRQQEQIIQLHLGMGSQRPLNGLAGLAGRLRQAEAEVWRER